MYEEQLVETNGVRLHVVFAGPENGKPVVLLHGFPEFWYGWRHQIEPLAAAGYRLIVPDQRGYNRSDKPNGVKHYHIDLLSKDIVGLLDKLGYTTADLVGHDWGGAVAWQLVTDYPQRFRKAVILNAPHLNTMGRAFLRKPVQLVKSWYIDLFQLPWFAEHVFFRPFARLAIGTAKPGSFTEDDMARYHEAWAQPGMVHSAINWYRSAFRGILRAVVGAVAHLKSPWALFQSPPISVPVLILWGEEDVALMKWLARDSAAHCTQSTLRIVPGASHWLQHDKPQEVTQAILDFLAE